MKDDDDDDDDQGLGATRFPVMPSLVAMQQMRNRLHLAQLGKKLMKWTAQATLRELRRVAEDLGRSYEAYREECRNAYILLARARFHDPQLNNMVVNNMESEACISVKSYPKSVAGVKILQLEIVECDSIPYNHLGLEKGGQAIQDARNAWRDLLKRMIMIAELRKSFIDVDAANKNATKRLELLENKVIPRLNATIDYILYDLEEKARDEQIRHKMEEELEKKAAAVAPEDEILNFNENCLESYIQQARAKRKDPRADTHKYVPIECSVIERNRVEIIVALSHISHEFCSEETETSIPMPSSEEVTSSDLEPEPPDAFIFPSRFDTFEPMKEKLDPTYETNITKLKDKLNEVIYLSKCLLESNSRNVSVDTFLNACEDVKYQIETFSNEADNNKGKVDNSLIKKLDKLKFHLHEVMELTKEGLQTRILVDKSAQTNIPVKNARFKSNIEMNKIDVNENFDLKNKDNEERKVSQDSSDSKGPRTIKNFKDDPIENDALSIKKVNKNVNMKSIEYENQLKNLGNTLETENVKEKDINRVKRDSKSSVESLDLVSNKETMNLSPNLPLKGNFQIIKNINYSDNGINNVDKRTKNNQESLLYTNKGLESDESRNLCLRESLKAADIRADNEKVKTDITKNMTTRESKEIKKLDKGSQEKGIREKCSSDETELAVETKNKLALFKSEIDDVINLVEEYQREGLLTPSVYKFIETCHVVKTKINQFEDNKSIQKIEYLNKHVSNLEKNAKDVNKECGSACVNEDFISSVKDFKTKLEDYKSSGNLYEVVEQKKALKTLAKELDEAIELIGLVNKTADTFISCCKEMKEKLKLNQQIMINENSDLKNTNKFVSCCKHIKDRITPGKKTSKNEVTDVDVNQIMDKLMKYIVSGEMTPSTETLVKRLETELAAKDSKGEAQPEGSSDDSSLCCTCSSGDVRPCEDSDCPNSSVNWKASDINESDTTPVQGNFIVSPVKECIGTPPDKEYLLTEEYILTPDGNYLITPDWKSYKTSFTPPDIQTYTVDTSEEVNQEPKKFQKFRQITKITRIQDENGTVSEETETITIKRKKVESIDQLGVHNSINHSGNRDDDHSMPNNSNETYINDETYETNNDKDNINKESDQNINHTEMKNVGIMASPNSTLKRFLSRETKSDTELRRLPTYGSLWSYGSLNEFRRANIIKKIVIPRIKCTLTYIGSELEEKEREDTFRLKQFKKIKDKKKKKSEEGEAKKECVKTKATDNKAERREGGVKTPQKVAIAPPQAPVKVVPHVPKPPVEKPTPILVHPPPTPPTPPSVKSHPPTPPSVKSHPPTPPSVVCCKDKMGDVPSGIAPSKPFTTPAKVAISPSATPSYKASSTSAPPCQEAKAPCQAVSDDTDDVYNLITPEKLGYFEKQFKEIVKVTRIQNSDGTVTEEKKVITIRTEKRHPKKIMQSSGSQHSCNYSVQSGASDTCCKTPGCARRSKSEHTHHSKCMGEPTVRTCMSVISHKSGGCDMEEITNLETCSSSCSALNKPCLTCETEPSVKEKLGPPHGSSVTCTPNSQKYRSDSGATDKCSCWPKQPSNTGAWKMSPVVKQSLPPETPCSCWSNADSYLKTGSLPLVSKTKTCPMPGQTCGCWNKEMSPVTKTKTCPMPGQTCGCWNKEMSPVTKTKTCPMPGQTCGCWNKETSFVPKTKSCPMPGQTCGCWNKENSLGRVGSWKTPAKQTCPLPGSKCACWPVHSDTLFRSGSWKIPGPPEPLPKQKSCPLPGKTCGCWPKHETPPPPTQTCTCADPTTQTCNACKTNKVAPSFTCGESRPPCSCSSSRTICASCKAGLDRPASQICGQSPPTCTCFGSKTQVCPLCNAAKPPTTPSKQVSTCNICKRVKSSQAHTCIKTAPAPPTPHICGDTSPACTCSSDKSKVCERCKTASASIETLKRLLSEEQHTCTSSRTQICSACKKTKPSYPDNVCRTPSAVSPSPSVVCSCSKTSLCRVCETSRAPNLSRSASSCKAPSVPPSPAKCTCSTSKGQCPACKATKTSSFHTCGKSDPTPKAYRPKTVTIPQTGAQNLTKTPICSCSNSVSNICESCQGRRYPPKHSCLDKPPKPKTPTPKPSRPSSKTDVCKFCKPSRMGKFTEWIDALWRDVMTSTTGLETIPTPNQLPTTLDRITSEPATRASYKSCCGADCASRMTPELEKLYKAICSLLVFKTKEVEKIPSQLECQKKQSQTKKTCKFCFSDINSGIVSLDGSCKQCQASMESEEEISICENQGSSFLSADTCKSPGVAQNTCGVCAKKSSSSISKRKRKCDEERRSINFDLDQKSSCCVVKKTTLKKPFCPVFAPKSPDSCSCESRHNAGTSTKKYASFDIGSNTTSCCSRTDVKEASVSQSEPAICNSRLCSNSARSCMSESGNKYYFYKW